MPGPELIFARPELLRRFREIAGGLADGLDVRRGALTRAVARHRLRTEPAYRVDGDALADDVRGLALTLRQLGEWVGEVGAAFDAAGRGISGTGLLGAAPGAVAAALPPWLLPGDSSADSAGSAGSAGDIVGGGLTVAAAVGAGLRRREVAAVARSLGAGAGSAGGAASSPTGRAAGLIDAAAAARIGVDEARHRWDAEPDREPIDRGIRAFVDGAMAGGGAFGGASAGASIGAALCAPSEVGVPACAAAGSYIGGRLGQTAGEWLSDQLLGEEPEAWDRPPEAYAEEVADVDAETLAVLQPVVATAAAGAAVAAARHNAFVVEHPWTADDGFERPPTPPAPPIRGPR